MNNKNVNIPNYTNSLLASGKLMSVDELLSNKAQNIHNQIYNLSKKKYIADHPEYSDDKYTWSEMPANDWLDCPSIIVISKVWPFKSKKIDISKYWKEINKYLKNNEDNWWYNTPTQENSNDSEITKIDYVNGNVKMESKMEGTQITVPFNEVGPYTPMNDKKCTLIDTFGQITPYQV